MLKRNNLNINNRIFQRDSLSPPLFCIALIPFSIEHKNTDYGYKTTTKKLNQLLNMNDLKLYIKMMRILKVYYPLWKDLVTT